MNLIAFDILQQLECYHPISNKPIDPEEYYEDIVMFSPIQSQKPQDHILYISMTADIEPLKDLSEHTMVILPADPSTVPQMANLSCICVWIPDIGHISGVINTLFAYRESLRTWENALNCSIAAQDGLQALLDISEPYFTDPIIIMTKTLRVLAYTRNIPASHPDIAWTIQNGYFPKHMIQGLIENNYLQAAESFHELGYHHPPNYFDCTKLIKVFDENSYQVHTVCLYGLASTPTPGVMFRMRMLVSAIERLITKDGLAIEPLEKRSVALIKEIIAKALPETELASKLTLLNWSANRPFRLFCVRFSRYFCPYVQYVLNCIQNEAQFYLTFQHKEEIVMLRLSKLGDSDETFQNNSKLIHLLQENAACCGISDEFSDISLLRSAFLQAQAAAELGSRLTPAETLHLYKKYYAYHVLALCSKETSLETLYYRGLDTLLTMDNDRGYNNIALLRSLLHHERNLTAVAKEMQMHRNSVLYRVGRLEQLLGVSLDDPDVRLMLQLSLRAHDLLVANHQKELAAEYTETQAAPLSHHSLGEQPSTLQA